MTKKIFVLLIFIQFSLFATAQKVIQMQRENGIFKISCSVNGAKMKMIFDTGASAVSLSESMANFLYDNDYISKEDILGNAKTQTADGSIYDNVVINIKDIEISGLHLKNVKALVISSQNAPLLLGQTAIQKLGRISLNGDKLIINDYEGDYSEEELDKLLEEATQYYNDGNYYASADCWLKFIDYGELTTYGYYLMISSFMYTNQYDEVIKYGKEWEIKYRTEKPDKYSSLIMGAIATSLDIKGDAKMSITYHEKSATIDSKLGVNPCITYAQIALSYYGIKDFNSAITYSKKALKGMFEMYKTSENEINTKGIDNENIGRCLYYYAASLFCKNDISSGEYILGLSANCNFEKAIEDCQTLNIKYKTRHKLFD